MQYYSLLCIFIPTPRNHFHAPKIKKVCDLFTGSQFIFQMIISSQENFYSFDVLTSQLPILHSLFSIKTLALVGFLILFTSSILGDIRIYLSVYSTHWHNGSLSCLFVVIFISVLLLTDDINRSAPPLNSGVNDLLFQNKSF